MPNRMTILISMVLFLSPLLQAEEIALTYEKADTGPSFFYMLPPSNDKAPSWKNGQEKLAADAMTYNFFLPFQNMTWSGANRMLLSLDTRANDAKHPDTLFIDLNGNLAIDENERFTHAEDANPPAVFGPSYHALAFQKIPLPCGDGEETGKILVNLYCMIPASDSNDDMGMLFGAAAWGCLHGKATLGGKSYGVTLFDQVLNGSFTDFEKTGSHDHDMLSVVPEDQDEPNYRIDAMQPLRRKTVIAGNAFSLKLEENAKKLILDPIQVKYGKISASGTGIALTVNHPEWGAQSIGSGETKSLPVGTWTIQSFKRQKSGSGPTCFYNGPAEKKIEISAGNTDKVDLATTLNATITSNRRDDIINLSLQLATAQGARFSAYAPGVNETNQFNGIPFKINDSTGKTVLEAKFKFG